MNERTREADETLRGMVRAVKETPKVEAEPRDGEVASDVPVVIAAFYTARTRGELLTLRHALTLEWFNNGRDDGDDYYGARIELIDQILRQRTC